MYTALAILLVLIVSWWNIPLAIVLMLIAVILINR